MANPERLREIEAEMNRFEDEISGIPGTNDQAPYKRQEEDGSFLPVNAAAGGPRMHPPPLARPPMPPMFVPQQLRQPRPSGPFGGGGFDSRPPFMPRPPTNMSLPPGTNTMSGGRPLHRYPPPRPNMPMDAPAPLRVKIRASGALPVPTDATFVRGIGPNPFRPREPTPTVVDNPAVVASSAPVIYTKRPVIKRDDEEVEKEKQEMEAAKRRAFTIRKRLQPTKEDSEEAKKHKAADQEMSRALAEVSSAATPMQSATSSGESQKTSSITITSSEEPSSGAGPTSNATAAAAAPKRIQPDIAAHLKAQMKQTEKAIKVIKRKTMRAVAGEVWEDKSLLDWDPNDFRIFCGDLGNEVSDEVLARAFIKYPTFVKAKVVRHKRTNKTRGFGFVSFKDPDDFVKAMHEMNGKYVGNRPIKLRKSTWEDRSLTAAIKREAPTIGEKHTRIGRPHPLGVARNS